MNEIEQPCGHCGELNPVSQRFCSACGTKFATTGRPPAAGTTLMPRPGQTAPPYAPPPPSTGPVPPPPVSPTGGYAAPPPAMPPRRQDPNWHFPAMIGAGVLLVVVGGFSIFQLIQRFRPAEPPKIAEFAADRTEIEIPGKLSLKWNVTGATGTRISLANKPAGALATLDESKTSEGQMDLYLDRAEYKGGIYQFKLKALGKGADSEKLVTVNLIDRRVSGGGGGDGSEPYPPQKKTKLPSEETTSGDKGRSAEIERERERLARIEQDRIAQERRRQEEAAADEERRRLKDLSDDRRRAEERATLQREADQRAAEQRAAEQRAHEARMAELRDAEARLRTQQLKQQQLQQQQNTPPPYAGPRAGTMTWQGDINGETLVTITDNIADVGAVSGTMPGKLQPGMLVNLVRPNNKDFLAFASSPGPHNNYRTLSFRVKGKGLKVIQIAWSLN